MPGAHSCLVVGLAGGSASGKSTFVASLRRALEEGRPRLRVEVVGTDNYFRSPEAGGPTFVSPSTGEVLMDCNRPDTPDNERLVADLDRRRAAADAPDVLIIEGLMVLHVDAIRERLDLRLFLELDADERALRRLVRNLGTASDPINARGAGSIANYYLESARPGHNRYVEPSRVYADLILRGDGDFGRTAPMVAAVIRDLRRHAPGGGSDGRQGLVSHRRERRGRGETS